METTTQNVHFDPETLNGLKAVLDETWASLSPVQRARLSQSVLAARILAAAGAGERDPARLRTSALSGLANG